MIGLMSKRIISASRTSQVWSFIRLIEFAAFIAGMFIAASLLSSLQADTSSAVQANKIFNMVRDVSLGKKFMVNDIAISNPDAILYVFGCMNYPSDAECDVEKCSGDDLSICVCEEDKLYGCQTESYRYPVRGYVRIKETARIRVERKDIDGVNSIVIEEVVK